MSTGLYEKTILALAQANAVFAEHADAQIGRLAALLERTGRLDTRMVVLLSDIFSITRRCGMAAAIRTAD